MDTFSLMHLELGKTSMHSGLYAQFRSGAEGGHQPYSLDTIRELLK